MELWIPITIAAAFLQNLRSALQKHLKGRLNTTGATFVRFGFGFPVAVVYVFALQGLAGLGLPQFNASFLAFGAAGGVTQIAATFLLVHLFSLRNFAVGTAYSKTEPIQAALFGIVFLGEAISPVAVVAIMVSLVGVLLISGAGGAFTWSGLLRRLLEPAALIGLASGALFGMSAVFVRGASLALGGPAPIMQAAYTLVWVTGFQTALMLGWMIWRDRAQIRAICAAWRPASLVGLAGICGSACWFTAMTLQTVAYVRALGQIELVFTLAASYLAFRERPTRNEVGGIFLIIGGILLLLLFR